MHRRATRSIQPAAFKLKKRNSHKKNERIDPSADVRAQVAGLGCRTFKITRIARRILLDFRRIDTYIHIVTLPLKIMYSLRLDPSLARLLKEVKARDGIPESEQIRRALVMWFEQKGALKPKRKA